MLSRVIITLALALGAIGKEIKSGSITLNPPNIQEVVEFDFSGDPATVIPKDGSIQYIFPLELSDTLPQTINPCVLEKLPKILKVQCAFVKQADGTIKLTANNFDDAIDSYFTLRVPGCTSPRSTAPTKSFLFTSYDASGKVLDFQTKGLVVTAKEIKYFDGVVLSSSSQIVAEPNVTLNLRFDVHTSFVPTDTIKVRIPKWNAQSKLKVYPSMAYDAVPVCKGKQNARAEITCSLPVAERTKTYDTLVLTNPFEYNVQSGETVAFTFSPLINPIATGQLSVFDIIAVDANGGELSKGQAFLTIMQEAVLSASSASLQVIDTTEVSKQTAVELALILPVPLDAGCFVEVTAPKLLSMDQVTQVQVFGIFGQQRDVSFTINTDSNSLVINNACVTHRDNPPKATANIQISYFTNPGYVVTNDSFRVYISDKDRKPIVSSNAGLQYTTTPGTINLGNWTVLDSLVGANTQVVFDFQPLDQTQDADTQIIISLPPEDFPKMPSTCEIDQTNFYVNAQTIYCKVQGHSFVIQRALKEPYEFDPKHSIKIGINNIQMPSSERPTGTYSIEFYDKIDGQYALVDTVQFKDKLRAKAGVLNYVNVVPVANTTFSEDTLNFEIKTSHAILKGGSIELTLPPELTLLDTATCDVSEISSAAKCVFDNTARKMSIVDGFTDGPQFDIIVPLKFSIKGIFTSRASKPTSNFVFRTLDAQAYEIDYQQSFWLPAFQASRPIVFAETFRKEATVGARATYQFSMKSPIPLYNGDVLQLTEPQVGISQNLSFNYASCSGITILRPDIRCSLRGINTIEITIALPDSAGTKIPADTLFSFSIIQIQNPPSTKPSSNFGLTVFDNQGNLLAKLTDDQSHLSKFVLSATQPSSLLYASVVSESRVPKSPTLLKFMIITQHELPARSSIVIKLPKLLGINKEQLSCWVSTDPGRDTNKNKTLCPLTPNADGSSTLIIKEVNSLKLIGGTTITFEIKGLVNAAVSTLSDSFKILTQTSEGFGIDQQNEGLVVSAACNYPCTTCPVNQPDVCRTCDQASDAPKPIYFKSQCINECPKGYFLQNNFCPICDSDCLECFGQSQKCTKCSPGKFLLGNTCLDVCPDDYYGDTVLNQCMACEKPCKTCSGSGSFCLSCDTTTPNYLFFDNACHTSCPNNISVFSQGKCLACSDNCKTCSMAFDACTTCSDGKYLSRVDQSCVETCPLGNSVAMFNMDETVLQTKTCELCNANCLTCDPLNPDICTECRRGLVMVENTKQCVSACPAKTATVWIPLTKDTLCAQCLDGCKECEYSRDHCTTCEDGFVFHQFSCLKECPAGYKAESGECLLSTIICPYGYVLNKETDKCELELAVCEAGYTLNKETSKCLPDPGFHFPFALLYAAIAWSYIILRGQNRSNFEREVIATQLLVGLTFIQQIGYFALFGLALKMGVRLLTGIHLVALIGHFFLNIASLVCFFHFCKDSVFNHWRKEDENDEDAYIIFATNTVFSFKAMRLFYCQLFSKKYFKAATEDQFRTFIWPMWLLTMASTVHFGVVLIANIYTMWLLRWGYEFKTLAIESSILGVIIFFLEVYEFAQYRRHQPKYMQAHEYVLTTRQKKRIAAVMGVADEESSAQYQMPNESHILETVIRRLTEADKLNKLEHNMIKAEQAYLADTTNEEDIRKRMLKSSAKHQQQLFREKRKYFEQFRSHKKQHDAQFDAIQEINLEQIEFQREERRSKLEKAMMDKQLKPVLPEIDFVLLHRIDSQFKYDVQLASISDIKSTKYAQTESGKNSKHITKSQGKPSGDRSARRTEKSARSMDMSNPDIERSSNLQRMLQSKETDENRVLSNLEKLQKLTEWELIDDNIQYNRALKFYKDDFETRAKNGSLVPNMKLHQSFDEDVLREMYEDFGPESDFESELSWISYPPKQGFLRDFWENNVKKQAENVVFGDKIKYKYQYNNCISEVYPIKDPEPRVVHPSRRTQTFGLQTEPGFDPFQSANEYSSSDEEEALSAIDVHYCKGLLKDVVEEGFSSDSGMTYRVGQKSASIVPIGKMKSRKRQRIGQGHGDDIQIETTSGIGRTESEFSQNQLGTVFDRDGKILYDKDYISLQEDLEDRKVDFDDMDGKISEPVEANMQPGSTSDRSASISDNSMSNSIKKRKRELSNLEKAYRPDARMLQEYGVTLSNKPQFKQRKSPIREGEPLKLSPNRKSEASKRSTSKPHADTTKSDISAKTSAVSITMKKAKKSDTDNYQNC